MWSYNLWNLCSYHLPSLLIRIDDNYSCSCNCRLGSDSDSNKSLRVHSRGQNFGDRWYDIVCSQFGYESFMHHLQKEFSVENLLFITEVPYCYLYIF